MGDGGALFTGAFLAGASILLSKESRVSFVVPLLVIGSFLFDTSYTLVRRILAGERILHAHCSHLYQRLARSGLSDGRVRLLYFGLNVLSVCSALLFINVDVWGRVLLALFVTCACAALLVITHRMERQALSALPRELPAIEDVLRRGLLLRVKRSSYESREKSLKPSSLSDFKRT